MTRFFSVLLLLIFVTSCATDRIRYVRVKGQKQEFVDFKEKPADHRIQEEQHVDLNILVEEDIPATNSLDLTADLADVEALRNQLSSKQVKDHSSDGGEIKESPTDERVDAALWAERQAFKGRKNLMLSVIFLGLSLIPVIGLILFLVPALILLIIGASHRSSANNSRYITVQGEAILRGSRVFLYIWLAYAFLLLILGVFIGLLFL